MELFVYSDSETPTINLSGKIFTSIEIHWRIEWTWRIWYTENRRKIRKLSKRLTMQKKIIKCWLRFYQRPFSTGRTFWLDPNAMIKVLKPIFLPLRRQVKYRFDSETNFYTCLADIQKWFDISINFLSVQISYTVVFVKKLPILWYEIPVVNRSV